MQTFTVAAFSALALFSSGPLNEPVLMPASATLSPSQLPEALDEQAPAWLKTHDVPSVAIAFISKQEENWLRVFGEQSPGVPATEDTLYNVASLTKPIVAETILRLVSAGTMQLDEPLSEYWIDPDVAENDWHKLLTPEIALRHRTGFTNWRYQTDDVLTFQWQPDTETGYSGEGFQYLVRAVEQKFDRDFLEIVKEQVFDPAGMQNTAFTPQTWFEERIAMVQGKDGTRKLPDTSEALSAADNLYTTIGDYAQFIAGAMNAVGLSNEIAESRQIVLHNEVDEACPPGIIDPSLCPVQAGWGLGWQVFDNDEDLVLVHTGKDWGERTIALFAPEQQFGLVILTSGANGMSVISEAMKLLYDNPELNAQIAARAKFDQ